MKLQILFPAILFGLICAATINAAESAGSTTNTTQTNGEKTFATFGEDTIFFNDQKTHDLFVKMTKDFREYQQYSEKISVDLMSTLKDVRTELGIIRDAITDNKVHDIKREYTYLTKLKNQLKDMEASSSSILTAYNHVSQIETVVANMDLSSEDEGKRMQYWDECKEAFNNCIDAIKDARKDIDTKRDQLYTMIMDVKEILK